jgi:chaperone required for assembly of F1-ATPase
MKRFYKLVSTAKEVGGYAILLDGKPVKTPAKAVLCAPSEDIANAIVKEWAAQQEKILPASMPLTQILSTKIDRVSAERAVMSVSVLKYLDTDLVCYRADHPPELIAMQEAVWNPPLVWFAQKFGALQTTTDLAALKQPAAAHAAVKKYVEALSDDHFTILQLITATSGSLVLAIGFTERVLSAQQVFDAARVEEAHKAKLYNEEKYGPDPAQEKKDKAMKADLDAAQTWLELL